MNRSEKEGQVILSEDFGRLRKLVPENSRVVVLYDSHIETWMKQMVDPGWEVFPLEAGEDLKQWNCVEKIVETFLKRDINRSWFLIGMGGGTVCDFAGFIGSVYMRGLAFGLVPTTLLAQVDAALGGKNGIHFGCYKNIIGCTVLPRWVLCNPRVLETLPIEEFRCGLAECIKHGAIASASYFSFIKELVASCKESDTFSGKDFHQMPLPALRQLIQGSHEIKMGIVEEDLLEEGVRKALNFGHTFGHAIAARYPSMRHGQAISYGMALAAAYSVEQGRRLSAEQTRHFSAEQGLHSSAEQGLHSSVEQGLLRSGSQVFLSPAEHDELLQLLTDCGLEVTLPYPERDIIPFMLHDKKRRGAELPLVLLSRIGQYVFFKEPIILWENRARNPGVCLGVSAVRDFPDWIDRAPWVELRLDLMPALSPVALLAFRMQCMGKEHRLMLTHLGSARPAAVAFDQSVASNQPVASDQPATSDQSAQSAVPSESQALVPEVLAEVISWGVGWVDVPLEAPADYAKELMVLARQHGAQIIRSAHFWGNAGAPVGEAIATAGKAAVAAASAVPSPAELDALAKKAFSSGADFLKVAVHTRSRQESDTLLAWCDKQNTRGVQLSGQAKDSVPADGSYRVPADGRYRVTVMIMGDDALRARCHALRNGYPFVYAAPEREGATAPGQPSFEELNG